MKLIKIETVWPPDAPSTPQFSSFAVCSISQTGSLFKDNKLLLKERKKKTIQWLTSRTYVLQNMGAAVHMCTLATRYRVSVETMQ